MVKKLTLLKQTKLKNHSLGHSNPCFNGAEKDKKFCKEHRDFKDRLREQEGLTRKVFQWEQRTYVFVDSEMKERPKIVELPAGITQAEKDIGEEWKADMAIWQSGHAKIANDWGKWNRRERTPESEKDFEKYINGFRAVKRGEVSRQGYKSKKLIKHQLVPQ